MAQGDGVSHFFAALDGFSALSGFRLKLRMMLPNTSGLYP
jgi:hypothetical protein